MKCEYCKLGSHIIEDSFAKITKFRCPSCGEYNVDAGNRYCRKCSEENNVCIVCGRSIYDDITLESKFPRKWKVIDLETDRVNSEVMVLDPNNPTELDLIYKYSEVAKKPFCDTIKDWADGYTVNRCLRGRRCKITGSPVCCCYCPHKGECLQLEDSPICGMVSTDTVSSNKECLEEPMV